MFRVYKLVNLAGDVLCDFSLQLEDVAEVALVSPGPQVRVFPGKDELHGYPNLLVCPGHGALDDRVDTQLLRYRRQGFS